MGKFVYYGRDIYTPSLYHHGIKGQKWGVRRFQNEDGTLTSAGKTRYNTMPSGNITIETHIPGGGYDETDGGITEANIKKAVDNETDLIMNYYGYSEDDRKQVAKEIDKLIRDGLRTGKLSAESTENDIAPMLRKKFDEIDTAQRATRAQKELAKVKDMDTAQRAVRSQENANKKHQYTVKKAKSASIINAGKKAVDSLITTTKNVSAAVINEGKYVANRILNNIRFRKPTKLY